jgi:hypothetical protein
MEKCQFHSDRDHKRGNATDLHVNLSIQPSPSKQFSNRGATHTSQHIPHNNVCRQWADADSKRTFKQFNCRHSF